MLNPWIPLPRVPVVAGRIPFLVERCRGKRVLHLGCVDAGLLDERLATGEHLHMLLSQVTTELWGIDIDAEGIAALRRRGLDRLIIGDVCNLDSWLDPDSVIVDVILASELIEHLMNPGLFLEQVRPFMREFTELIITLPNAFRLETLRALLRSVECVHPDHNYWFSYHTARNLIEKAGYRIDEIYVYSLQPFNLLPRKVQGETSKPVESIREPPANRQRPSWWIRGARYLRSLPWRLVVRWFYRRSPFWGDGLIFICRLPTDAPPDAETKP